MGNKTTRMKEETCSFEALVKNPTEKLFESLLVSPADYWKLICNVRIPDGTRCLNCQGISTNCLKFQRESPFKETLFYLTNLADQTIVKGIWIASKKTGVIIQLKSLYQADGDTLSEMSEAEKYTLNLEIYNDERATDFLTKIQRMMEEINIGTSLFGRIGFGIYPLMHKSQRVILMAFQELDLLPKGRIRCFVVEKSKLTKAEFVNCLKKTVDKGFKNRIYLDKATFNLFKNWTFSDLTLYPTTESQARRFLLQFEDIYKKHRKGFPNNVNRWLQEYTFRANQSIHGWDRISTFNTLLKSALNSRRED